MLIFPSVQGDPPFPKQKYCKWWCPFKTTYSQLPSSSCLLLNKKLSYEYSNALFKAIC